MMKILLTGASGFIGSTFLRRFAAEPRLSLYGVGRRPVDDFPSQVRYQALPLDRLESLDIEPDVVIHAAGRASPWGTDREYYRDNVQSTQQTLAFCRTRQHPRFIFLSTAAVYYRFAHQFQLAENTPVGPGFTSKYARSKFLAEREVNDYCGEKTIFRPCGVFGPGDNILFPPLLTAARQKRLVNLRSDAPAQAEIIHVDSLCEYLMQAATVPRLKPCYNISAAYPLPVEALLHDVLRQLDLPLPGRAMSVDSARRIAGVLEAVWRIFPLKGEPPVTRFGIGVFGYSATLDVSRMLTDFGPPDSPLLPALHQFLQDYKARNI